MSKAAVGPNGAIATSLALFKLEIGRYPTTAEGLHALAVRPATLTSSEAACWHRYIEKPEMLMDAWARPHQYTYPGNANKETYDLWSNGPDGQSGTADDICNWPRDVR